MRRVVLGGVELSDWLVSGSLPVKRMVGLGARRIALLREAADRLGYGAAVSRDFTVLGSTSAFVPSCSPKELERLGAACRTIVLLCSVRFSTAVFQLKSRVYAVSKILFGWISRVPSLLRGRTQQAANKFLRAIITGGLCHVDCLAGVVLCRVVSSLRDRGLVWSDVAPRGTPLGALQGWFRARGFALVRPWVWSVGTAVTEVSLSGGPLTRLMPTNLGKDGVSFSGKGFLRATVMKFTNLMNCLPKQFRTVIGT